MNKELFILTNLILFTMLIIAMISSMNMMKFHPIAIIIILLILSIFTCLNLSLWKSNYLYSIMLFLIMVSGLMIIFLYFASLISNEKMKMNMNWMLFNASILNFSLLFLLINNLKIYNFTMMKFNYNEINFLMKFNEMNFQNILNLYEYPFNNLTLMTMFFLLISLFSIVKSCSFKSMTLRKIN